MMMVSIDDLTRTTFLGSGKQKVLDSGRLLVRSWEGTQCGFKYVTISGQTPVMSPDASSNTSSRFIDGLLHQ